MIQDPESIEQLGSSFNKDFVIQFYTFFEEKGDKGMKVRHNYSKKREKSFYVTYYPVNK